MFYFYLYVNVIYVRYKLIRLCGSKPIFSLNWTFFYVFCTTFFVYSFVFLLFGFSKKQKRLKHFKKKEADICPLLDVDDMVYMGNRPDPKCVFTYLQSLYRKLTKLDQPIKMRDIVEKKVEKPKVCRTMSLQRQKSVTVEISDMLWRNKRVLWGHSYILWFHKDLKSYSLRIKNVEV